MAAMFGDATDWSACTALLAAGGVGALVSCACAMGDELKAAVVVSALKYVQPSCPHVTNILHIHSAHDNYNVPTDPPNGTKPGGAQLAARIVS